MMYKTGVLEITSDVRSKPLGQKRKRGRPAKLPFCLVRSPPNRDTARDTTAPVNVENVDPVELSPPDIHVPSAVYQPPATPVTTSPDQSSSDHVTEVTARRNIFGSSSTPASTEAHSSPPAPAPLRCTTRRKPSNKDKPIEHILPAAKRKGNFKEPQVLRKKSKNSDPDYEPIHAMNTRSRKN